MAYDFKKEEKYLYAPKKKAEIVQVPPMKFLTIEGKGDPNKEDGDYKIAVPQLYALAYTLRMSYKTEYQIPGYFEYVVPPLEGFWWQGEYKGYDMSNKAAFNWLSCLRLPDFIREEDVVWAKEKVLQKKGHDCSAVNYQTIEEGTCVQILHVGPYDTEIESVKLMDEFLEANGYQNDFTDTRRHHEIYLSDPNKVAPEKLKTILRHPVKKLA